MTATKQTKIAAVLMLGALVAFATLVGPASARWYGNNYQNNNGWNNRWQGNGNYYGQYYRQPPIVYGSPYYGGNGYYAPPVVYDGTPGLSIHL